MAVASPERPRRRPATPEPDGSNPVERLLSRKYVTPVCLAAIFILAWLYYATQALQSRNFVIMTDELQYVKLAINTLNSPVPELHGVSIGSYNQLYPWLIAPLAAIFDSMPDLYLAIHVLDPFLMTSVVIPVFLLARSAGASRLGALVAAGISVAGPWLVFSTLMMTENVAYPAFVLVIFAFHRTLAKPSPGNDLLALAAILFGIFARTQFVVLAAVLPVAVLLYGGLGAARGGDRESQLTLFRDGVADAIRHHRTLFRALGAGAVVLLIVVLVASPFGIYDAAFRRPLLPKGAVFLAGRHLGTLAVGFGLIPMVAGVAFALSTLRSREAGARPRAFATLAVVAVGAVMYQASAFNINFSAGWMNDRYVFYILPLFAIGLVLAVEACRPSFGEVAVAGLLVAAVVYDAHFAGYPGRAWVGAPSAVIDPVLNGRLAQVAGTSAGPINVVMTVATLIAAAYVYWCRTVRSRLLALTLLTAPVFLWCLLTTRYLFDKQEPFSRPTLTGIKASLHTANVGYNSNTTVPAGQAPPLDWVDRKVPEGPVGLLPSEDIAIEGWWQDEFWNRRVDRVLRFINPSQSPAYRQSVFQKQLDTLHHDRFRIDLATGRFEGIPRDRMPARVVVSANDVRFGFANARTLTTHSDIRAGLPTSKRLLAVDTPYRARWVLTNTLDDGHLLVGRSQLRIFPSPSLAGRIDVSLRLERVETSLKRTSWYARFPSSAARGEITRRAARSTVRGTVCMPSAGRIGVVKLRAVPRPKPPDALYLSGVAVRSVSVRATNRPCQ